MTAPPLHLVPDDPRHGVALYAAQVARAVGAEAADLDAVLGMPRRPVHVHVSDRLFGATCEEAAERLVAVGRRHPTTLTLHDLPQPEDGPVFARRSRAYAEVVAAGAGWVTSSHHEAALAHRHLDGAEAGAVIPLPVMPLPVMPLPVMPLPVGPLQVVRAAAGSTGPERATVLGVLGWIYPGKGHLEVLHAAAALPAPVVVRALGGVAPGHEPLRVELDDLARHLGVGLEVTGWVADADLPAALGAVDVPVAAHRKVSASGSINSWVAGSRRPLVAAGDYSRELAALRPGTITLVGAGTVALADAVRRAAGDPGSTRLAPGTPTAPGLTEVAAAYLAWWASR